MHKFAIGSVFLKLQEKEIHQRMNEVFYEYHKKNPNKVHFLDENKFPVFKKTGDIFSLVLWVVNEKGIEHRIFLDGSVFLNTLTVHTITLDGENFEKETVDEFLFVFQTLFNGNANGYIFYELDGYTHRITEAGLKDYKELIDEIFEAVPVEKQLSFEVLKENLTFGFSD